MESHEEKLHPWDLDLTLQTMFSPAFLEKIRAPLITVGEKSPEFTKAEFMKMVDQLWEKSTPKTELHDAFARFVNICRTHYIDNMGDKKENGEPAQSDDTSRQFYAQYPPPLSNHRTRHYFK